jgi:hypothetical protein
LLQRAAAITCGLLLLHSIVDYPLREPALAALFGLFCGFMTFSHESRRRSKSRRVSEKSDTVTFAPFDVPRTKPIFGRGESST